MINNMLIVVKMYCINVWIIVLYYMYDLLYLILDEIVFKLKFKIGEYVY